MVNRFVACDIGASNTRFLSNDGSIHVLPNNMVFIRQDERVDLMPNSNDVESALDITIECDNGCNHFPARVLIGQMATRYSASNVRPSILQNKSQQRINYISAIAAVALNLFKIGRADELDLYLALPPVEVKGAKDLVRNNLVGKYTVTFHKMGNFRVEFSIRDVHIFEESFLAIMSYFFNMDGSVRDTASKYASGSILSLDIGASTTDLAVVTNMKYLEKSGQTYKTGGNVARDYLANYIRANAGYDVTDEMAESAIAEGRIQYGNDYMDCSDAVSEAKRELANQIVNQMQTYFRMVNIPMQTIRAIVVSGGGSMEGFYVDGNGETHHTSNPISDYITDELSKVCSGIMVERFEENPRMANVMGLFIRANIENHRRKQMEMQEQAQNQAQMQTHTQAQPQMPQQPQMQGTMTQPQTMGMGGMQNQVQPQSQQNMGMQPQVQNQVQPQPQVNMNMNAMFTQPQVEYQGQQSPVQNPQNQGMMH